MADVPGFNLNVSGQIPGEAVIVAVLSYAEKFRETMLPETRDSFDKIQLSLMKGWINWWVDRGWPGEKV